MACAGEATCAQCGGEGKYEGRDAFAGSRYCGACWGSWVFDPITVCKDCGKARGSGSDFRKEWCNSCWEAWEERRSARKPNRDSCVCAADDAGRERCGACKDSKASEERRSAIQPDRDSCACSAEGGTAARCGACEHFKAAPDATTLASRCRQCDRDVDLWRKGYCRLCWESWCTRIYTGGPPVRRKFGRHYDFVEVGTSDWGTLTQYCAGDLKEGSVLAEWIRTSLDDLRLCRGLAVECVAEYLHALPELPRVAKVAAAMDEHSGEDQLYFVPVDIVERHMGCYTAPLPVDREDAGVEPADVFEVDVMWYAKSLSSISKPQPQLVKMLETAGISGLLEQRRVRTLSWADLCREQGVDTVDVVQLDCEGKDCAIIRGLLAHCEQYPESFPRVIQFELNHLTDQTEGEDTLEALYRCGYSVRLRTDNNVVVERLAGQATWWRSSWSEGKPLESHAM